jgi:hypothetical protein
VVIHGVNTLVTPPTVVRAWWLLLVANLQTKGSTLGAVIGDGGLSCPKAMLKCKGPPLFLGQAENHLAEMHCTILQFPVAQIDLTRIRLDCQIEVAVHLRQA